MFREVPQAVGQGLDRLIAWAVGARTMSKPREVFLRGCVAGALCLALTGCEGLDPKPQPPPGYPVDPAVTIRYKNRLQGYYRVRDGGAVVQEPSTWRAPRRLFIGLSEFASPDFLPAEVLRPLAEPIRSVFGFYDAKNIGHGNFVFSLLVEANPHHPFVLMEFPGFERFGLKDFCDASGSEASTERLLTQARTVATELHRIIAQHNIRFVNVSGGQMLGAVKEAWQVHCGGIPPDDDILRRKLDTLRLPVERLSEPAARGLLHRAGVGPG
ncbi:hypothetical protein [Myxococcus landrumensis]|uniref:hypothetical protein n=1 Tax=Myxococcus landrumensis TaxID=2813577 RepID=UPI001F50871E|nr:hypothetical protein [Myxococcus landrumus]